MAEMNEQSFELQMQNSKTEMRHILMSFVRIEKKNINFWMKKLKIKIFPVLNLLIFFFRSFIPVFFLV